MCSWSGTDSNPLTTGTIAMYSWQNTGAQFDNVLVRNLSVPLAGVGPGSGEEARFTHRGALPVLPGSLIAMLVADHREPRPIPNPEPEPLRLAMIVPRFDASSADGRQS